MNPDPKPFRFKQFEIHQHQSAMKVGTDGVLLGAYTKVNAYQSILDIGCGTGLISLMLAQKSEALITAIEIDPKAAEQAKYNVSISPWPNRIQIINDSIQEFEKSITNTYDLIISNPPFFNTSNKRDAREIARNQASLSFKELIRITSKLLSDQGTFGVIIPNQDRLTFTNECEKRSLFLKEYCLLKGSSNTKAKRCLLYFSRTKASLKESTLTIEKEKRHDYTEAYKKLVEPYLL